MCLGNSKTLYSRFRNHFCCMCVYVLCCVVLCCVVLCCVVLYCVVLCCVVLCCVIGEDTIEEKFRLESFKTTKPQENLVNTEIHIYCV